MYSLSGQTHTVYTGVCIVNMKKRGEGSVQAEIQRKKEGTEHFCFHEATEVTFAELSSDVLESYVASGEPL